MNISWTTVWEVVIAGLILAIMVGVGRLAFFDWEAFRRLSIRLAIASFILLWVATLAAGFWVSAVAPNSYVELRKLADQENVLPPSLVEAFEREEEARSTSLWIPVPFVIFLLYLGTVYLFARPVLSTRQKRQKAIETTRRRLQGLEREAARQRKELERLEAGDKPDSE